MTNKTNKQRNESRRTNKQTHEQSTKQTNKQQATPNKPMIHGTQTFRTHVSGLTEAAQQHAGDFQDAVDQLLQPWQRRATADCLFSY